MSAPTLDEQREIIDTPGTLWERVADRKRVAGCACAHNVDGSTTTILCPVHSDTDPCERMARVTGKRRKGTIRRGVCTNCGWQGGGDLERARAAHPAGKGRAQ